MIMREQFIYQQAKLSKNSLSGLVCPIYVTSYRFLACQPHFGIIVSEAYPSMQRKCFFKLQQRIFYLMLLVHFFLYKKKHIGNFSFWASLALGQVYPHGKFVLRASLSPGQVCPKGKFVPRASLSLGQVCVWSKFVPGASLSSGQVCTQGKFGPGASLIPGQVWSRGKFGPGTICIVWSRLLYQLPFSGLANSTLWPNLSIRVSV